VLQHPRLLSNLQRFCDPTESRFRGFPSTRVDARRKWAQAFSDYLGTIEEAIPRPPPPPDSHDSLDLSDVEPAFFAALKLAETMATDIPAEDFAGAWQQSILSITATVSGVTSAGTIYRFLAFTNITSLRGTLQAQLLALFRSPPSALSLPRLSAIATAFHDATRGLIASMTLTIGTSTSIGAVSVR
jgi:hypothetical protein